MDWTTQHPHPPTVSFDGGDLTCGNGLLLLIRKHIDPLNPSELLEIRSTDATVEVELPAWCRLTKNELVSATRQGNLRSFLISKGPFLPVQKETEPAPLKAGTQSSPSRATPPPKGPQPILPLSVMGIGSWPRPHWLLEALHNRLSNRLSEEQFQQYADDAVRLVVAAQDRSGVDVITDGEQRRDNYASFVGNRLDNCQLIPITDLLPYVDDPEQFARELESLDVPAEQVRHPAVFGRIERNRPLAVHELTRLQRITEKPIKIALPGPYLLTRTMWLECVSDRAYPNREALADDIVQVLRDEIEALLNAGASLVQLDEPVLTEVVFTRPTSRRTFMCGALGEKRPPQQELAFAQHLLSQTLKGFPQERLALHICRGNWTKDERVALTGPYTPLLELLQAIPVGTYFLEMATPRAGELDVLKELPAQSRLGLGVVNQKEDRVETVEEIVQKAEKALAIFGPERLLLNPDCGFATFADNPIATAEIAEAKLSNIVQAAKILRSRYTHS